MDYRRVYIGMEELHNQGFSPVEIAKALEQDGVHASAVAVEIHLGKKFGYCWLHYQIMTWEHKCPKC